MITKTQAFNPPFTNLTRYISSGLGDKPTDTKNIYNSFGVIVARAIDYDTAALIAAALNSYKPEDK